MPSFSVFPCVCTALGRALAVEGEEPSGLRGLVSQIEAEAEANQARAARHTFKLSKSSSQFRTP